VETQTGEDAMARYFFHMATRTQQISDEKGKEVKDLAEAHEHALHLIHRAMCSLRSEQTSGWMIKVLPESGGTSLTVLFPTRHILVPSGTLSEAGILGLLFPILTSILKTSGAPAGLP
jgi:Domain of unknown function (DUF6894)